MHLSLLHLRRFLCRCTITGGLRPRLWSFVPPGLILMSPQAERVYVLNLSFGSYRMKLNGKFFASLRRRRKSQRCWQEVLGCSSTKARLKSRKKHCVFGRYNGDAKAIVLCVAYNFHEPLGRRSQRSEFTSFFYFLFYFRKLNK